MPLPSENPHSSPTPADDLIGALLRHFSAGSGAAEPALLRDLRAELEDNGLLRDDMLRLWQMLHACNARAGLSVPVPAAAGEPVRLLNLACAHCEEAPLLGAFFGGGSPVRFYGMDVRPREIDLATRRYEVTEKFFRRFTAPPLRGEGSAFEFIADDATRLGGYRQLPEAFDIVFMRHQNIWNDRKVWSRIFAFALDRLAGNGQLVITSYFDREHLLALETIKSLGAEVRVSLPNPHSRELDYPWKSVDRHMAVLARPKTESTPLILP